jgi:2-C-methyl-D-erythritol 2,4-cyclodiphosphate synthase
LGFDSHGFATERPLVLGGVRVPCDLGLRGHSDADVLVHAVIDALLGAAGKGNIGERFPDHDPAYANADSCTLLEEVWRDLSAVGFEVVNVDAVLVADKPRLGPYLLSMSERLGGILGVPTDRVAVKPKTREGLPPETGPGGIAALAVVLLRCLRD